MVVSSYLRWGVRAGSKFAWIFKISLLFLFFAYLLIHAIAIGIQERSATAAIIEIGTDLAKPMQSAQEVALGIVVDPPGDLFESGWALWKIYFYLYQIYLWFKLMLLIVKFFLDNANSPLLIFLAALTLFFIVQVLVAVIAFDQPPGTPFVAGWDILKGIYTLIVNTDISTKEFLEPNNVSCTGESCVI